MKRIMALLIVLLCSATAWAQLASLPDDSRFDETVEFKTDADGESLRAMIDGLARSIGLTPIVDSVPDTTILYNIDDPKPFRQIWQIVLTQYNLDYVLQPNNVVVIGPSASLAQLKGVNPTAMSDSTDGEPVLTKFYRVNNQPSDVAVILRSAVPGIEVQELSSVSSIAVLGTQAQQDQVQATLDQFDSVAEQIILEQRIYSLSNAKASELAEVLGNTNLNSSTTVSTIGADDAAASEDAPVNNSSTFSVVADDRTNSLIVTAPASIQARIAEIIPSLDTPQRQVNVQVRIQEIKTSTARDLGVNLTAGVGNFAATVLDTGLSFIFDAQNAISGLNIGAVLDTLEEQGLSRRVDDSSVTVLDNETGEIQSGGTIYISIAGADENIERTIPYGVQIEVTPQISADGRIIMNVSARVENPISDTGDPAFLEISTRRVNSTVTLEPGQTVLLGGLFQNEFTTSDKRVPVLGSIPLVGNLFKTSTEEESNTELLLIVNAMVIE